MEIAELDLKAKVDNAIMEQEAAQRKASMAAAEVWCKDSDIACFSRSAALGSSVGLFTFNFLLGLAIALKIKHTMILVYQLSKVLK